MCFRFFAIQIIFVLVFTCPIAYANIADSLLRKAAEGGDPVSQFTLGVQLFQSENPAELEESIKWLKRAANQSHVHASLLLGAAYDEGRGVDQNLKAAKAWYLAAATQGDSTAQFSVAMAYYLGRGVSVDHEKAHFWAQKSAMQQNVEAYILLSDMYEFGSGVAVDLQTSLSWALKAAELNHPIGMLRAGDVYTQLLAANVDDAPILRGKAIEYYKSAVDVGLSFPGAKERGLYRAFVNLALMYEQQGSSQGYKEMLYWARRGANLGIPRAQGIYALCLIKGMGIEKNIEKAVAWAVRGAKGKDGLAMLILADLSNYGPVIGPNITRAYMWYKLAAAHDRLDARENFDELVEWMDDDDIQEAERLVEKCVKSDYQRC